MIIGVDLDEVLCEFLRSLIKFHNEAYGSSFRFEDFFSFEFWKVWGGDIEDTKDKLFEFYETDFFNNIIPVQGAINSIKTLSKNHELVIITARQEAITNETKAWLDKYFKNLFKDVFFVNHLARVGIPRSKGDVCDELGVDVMIEDNYDYAVDCARGNRHVVLFNKPWNVKERAPKNVVRFDSWDKCVDFINSLN